MNVCVVVVVSATAADIVLVPTTPPICVPGSMRGDPETGAPVLGAVPSNAILVEPSGVKNFVSIVADVPLHKQ